MNALQRWGRLGSLLTTNDDNLGSRKGFWWRGREVQNFGKI